MSQWTTNLPLLAKQWPDAIDSVALIIFFAVVIGIPVFGYILMYCDILEYFRRLKGALVRVVYHFPDVPAWARMHTPYSIRALGLRLPCTEADLKKAYRSLAEKCHPDRGGDPQKFHQLRQHFEAATSFVRKHEDEWKGHKQLQTDMPNAKRPRKKATRRSAKQSTHHR